MSLSELEIRDFYRKYAAMVWRRCYQILSDEEEARDAMHDVFVKLMDKKKTVDRSFPSSLLYTMATHTCLNRIRDNKNRGRLLSQHSLEFAEVEDEAPTLTRIFAEKIFKRETHSTRVMAYMHYADGMTLKEVAAETGLSISGVRKRLDQLKSRIRLTHKEPL